MNDPVPYVAPSHDNLTTAEHAFLVGFTEMMRLCGSKESSNGFRENYKALLEVVPEELRDTVRNMQKAEKIALMGTELGEMLEGIRGKNISDKLPGFSAEEEELADVFIRGMSYGDMFSLRLGFAIIAKARYNNSRPYKHGKKF